MINKKQKIALGAVVTIGCVGVAFSVAFSSELINPSKADLNAFSISCSGSNNYFNEQITQSILKTGNNSNVIFNTSGDFSAGGNNWLSMSKGSSFYNLTDIRGIGTIDFTFSTGGTFEIDYSKDRYNGGVAVSWPESFHEEYTVTADQNLTVHVPAKATHMKMTSTNDGYLKIKTMSINFNCDTYIELDDWDFEHGFKPIDQGDNTLTYGLYPKIHVNNTSLITELEARVALLDIKDEEYFWYNSECYVKDTCVRGYPFSDGTVPTVGSTYFFKCAPITWNIVGGEGKEYKLTTTELLNVQAFGEFYEGKKAKEEYNNPGVKADVYANNYRFSDLRTWLNTTFYNQAFFYNNSAIKAVEVDNSVASTDQSTNPYVCENTTDKVYASSVKEMKDLGYPVKNFTDYALCNGAIPTSESFTNGSLTRSPIHVYSYDVFLVTPTRTQKYENRSVNYDWLGPCIGITIENKTWDDEHGVNPVVSVDGKTVTYGLYPQTRVTDDELIAKLAAVAPATDETYFLYGHEYYVKDTKSSETAYFECEPLKWNIVAQDDETYTLHSAKAIYPKAFDNDSNVYKDSDIRTWLNGEFYNKAFRNVACPETESHIKPTTLSDISTIEEPVVDNVWLGSTTEYTNWYSSNETRRKTPTDFASFNNIYESGGYVWYWTHTAINTNQVDCVGSGGGFGKTGYNDAGTGVAPCLTISK